MMANEIRQDISARADGSCSRIVLTGFRATGKSHVGRILAARIGYRFLDSDELLSAGMESGISGFVKQHGWPAFREKERQLLKSLAAEQGAVIATGGGAILHRDEWRQLRRNSLVIWLRADAGTIRARLRGDGATAALRPSLTGAGSLDEVDQVLAEREPLYREGSDLALDTAGLPPEKIVAEITAYLARKDKEQG
jgi:shikimate kinase